MRGLGGVRHSVRECGGEGALCGAGGEDGRGTGLPSCPPSQLSCSGVVKSGKKRKREERSVCRGRSSWVLWPFTF